MDRDRRRFLKTAGGLALGAGLGAALGSPARATGVAPPRVERYRKLGRTGLEISDISFGSSQTADPAVARHAFELGINYFDTAPRYKDTESETALGWALKGLREKVIIASKVKCWSSTKRGELMGSLEGSLRRLQTDRIDVFFNHGVNRLARLQNPEWDEFIALAKKQGKIRFVGMSGHGGLLTQCVDYVLKNDLVDVLLCAHNYGQDPAFYEKLFRTTDRLANQEGLPPLLAKAREQGVGVIAMKTLRGARLNDMRPFEQPGGTYSQAAFRWVLSRPHVDALIVSMKTREQVEEYLVASGAPAPGQAEVDLLQRYELANGAHYCEPGCDACHASCPAGVSVNEVLRTRMYSVDYGDVDYARENYARLADLAADTINAAACLSCTARPCATACPKGLNVGALTEAAHRLLS